MFPLKKASDMHDRILWIETNEDFGKLRDRFSMVFTCEFVKSTYYKHKKCWEWLRASGFEADILADKKPWSDFAAEHEEYRAIKSKDPIIID
jgi:hypothetical protein